MKPIIVQESVVAERMGYAETVLDNVPYQEARRFCEERGWRMPLYGRVCRLRIVRSDEEHEGFPAFMRLNGGAIRE